MAVPFCDTYSEGRMKTIFLASSTKISYSLCLTCFITFIGECWYLLCTQEDFIKHDFLKSKKEQKNSYDQYNEMDEPFSEAGHSQDTLKKHSTVELGNDVHAN